MADQFSIMGTFILMMFVDFKQMVIEFKKHFGLDASQNFPVLSIAENKLCQSDARFEFSIVADDEWEYKDSIQAYYKHCANKHEIGIKESVYNKARNGDRNALNSIAHEISHWALINYFKITLGVNEFEQLDPITRVVIINIHENIAGLMTLLLVFREEDLLDTESARDLDFGSCMSQEQISLALFYLQNHDALTNNFMRKLVSVTETQKQEIRRID